MKSRKPKKKKEELTQRQKVEKVRQKDPLDDALQDSFPASDPPSMTEPHQNEPSDDRTPRDEEEQQPAPGP